MPPSWKMKGEWLKNCSCNEGCPCDFWEKPTQTKCEGMVAMHIKEGHFGPTSLSGLKFAATYHWPGPLHEGQGTLQALIDEKADAKQREALLTILTGQAGNPWFEVVASLVSNLLEPKFVPIHFSFDMDKRAAKVTIPGQLETESKPIKNLVSGDDHRIRVQLPEGMEYKVAEVATAVVNRSTGQVKYDCAGGHSSLALVEHTEQGLA